MDRQLDWQARAAAGEDAEAQYRATSRAYVRFALDNPQHFRLMFRRARLDPTSEHLQAAAPPAFSELLAIVGTLVGRPVSMDDARDAADVLLTWSCVHGFAHLLLEGQIARRAGADSTAALSLVEQLAARAARGITTPAD